uniref:Uncharacterized protein n=1 Tax=Amphimedon queenslandica TaxID=400682 RepID=A0A1X7U7Z1_AMPQE
MEIDSESEALEMSGGVFEGVAEPTCPCSDDDDSDCQIVSINSPIVIKVWDSSDNICASASTDQCSSDEDNFAVEISTCNALNDCLHWGWKKGNDDVVSIDWEDLDSAESFVSSYVTCGCKTGCNTGETEDSSDESESDEMLDVQVFDDNCLDDIALCL